MEMSPDFLVYTHMHARSRDGNIIHGAIEQRFGNKKTWTICLYYSFSLDEEFFD